MTNVYVHPTAIVDKGVKLGSGTKVWHFVHLMENAKLGKDCIVADYVHVGRNVTVGDNVKLENRATVYEGVTIQEDVFVGPNVTFTNDLYPRSFNKDWKISQTLIKKGSSLGAGTIIVCGVTIGKFVLVGSGSVVTTDIPDYALVYGNPARIKGFVCKCGKKLEKTDKQGNHVGMKCHFCKAQYQIPVKDYAQLEKES